MSLELIFKIRVILCEDNIINELPVLIKFLCLFIDF